MSLNKEQLRLVESDMLGHSLIRGIAGSGKTTVGISRVHYLLEKYAREQEQVLFVTYNKSLSKYLEYLYEKIKPSENISLFGPVSYKNRVKFKTIDSLMVYYFYQYCKEKQFDLELAWEAPYEVWREAIGNVQKKYPEVKLLHMDHVKFLKDEIKWLKGCDYAKLEVYQEIDRKGRGAGQGEGPSRLGKHSVSRESIYELMLEVDRLLILQNKVDGATANLLALRYVEEHEVPYCYKHVIVDEAQDLTKVQLKFLSHIKAELPESSLLFLMDGAQSIYPQAWLGKGHPFTTIGYDMKGRASKLSKNYRTTTEISKCAYSLLAKEKSIVDEEYFITPSLLERHGDYPVYRDFATNKAQNEYVVKLIKQFRKEGVRLRDIAVVSKINKNLEILQGELLDHKIDALVFKNNKEIEFQVDKVKLLTMHSVKGLEFKVVILIDLNSEIIPYIEPEWSEEQKVAEEIMERKLLYVGMTRAQKNLFMCSYGEPSKFMRDIDRQFLTMQTGCHMGAYYTLPYEDYQFTDKIAQVTQEEESVRQWVIQELMQSYGYPKELIQVEYPVKNFSQQGKVDVVVMNGKLGKPYIFIETKQKGVKIQEAIEQLRSYMNVSQAKFGIATNGMNIAFLDESGQYIKDIPKCSVQILPSSTESYELRDIISYKTYTFERDMSAMEILVNEAVVPRDETTTLKVYSDIAAGLPIEIQDDIKGNFALPTEYLRGRENLFMLKVKGESMIGAGIESGDLVIIQKTVQVEDHQIAAVEYNGGTTLKKIMKMGDGILLISENPAYEPINIAYEELRIVGRLVGVVKANNIS